MLYRLHRIWTELSHDVLNPAHVPLSWANSPTLGTYYRPRLRRADIEVPNLPVDVNSWGRSACSKMLLQRCLNPCFSKFPRSSDYVINLRFTKDLSCRALVERLLVANPHSLVVERSCLSHSFAFSRLRCKLACALFTKKKVFCKSFV